MKSLTKLFLLLVTISIIQSNSISSSIPKNIIPYTNNLIPIQQVEFLAPNIRTWVYNTGIINQDKRTANTPGFEWPINSGKFAVYTSGLCIAAMVGGQLREAMASYQGEYAPGYVNDTGNFPYAVTNSTFKVYKVKTGDNANNNPDWANWGLMVPFGAPYYDVNHNNIYDPQIDSPGVRGAYQTLFVCLTDGFPEEHKIGEGFGGGTLPIFAEVHMTAWSSGIPGLEDVQYLKYEIFNRSKQPWNSTYLSFVADPDLGGVEDDYIGCDTNLRLVFDYNGDNMDTGNYSYGANPPAVGFTLLDNAINKSVNPPIDLKMSSFTYFTNTSTPGPACEKDPNGEEAPAYYMMKGLKKDLTPWVIPPGGINRVNKFCYSGDPETGIGWNEGPPGNPTGSIQNCGGPNIYNGSGVYVNPVGDRRLIVSSGAENFTVVPREKQTMTIAQFIARGSSNLNSVTKLKQKAQFIRNLYVIGIEKKSTNTPESYKLYQNYPNPFNPTTKIRFEIPLLKGVPEGRGVSVKLIIYDILGKELTTLVNEQLNSGKYEVEWNANNYPSGIYFYTLQTKSFSQTNKMVLLK
ncbi:MAG: T9SS C-terminal target domain-containing protein [Ignavibacteriae bacterium]|nr:MAG: T9SS C-terminal target domain-containing protein [Ignavibacteriota bacterium]